MIPVALLVMLAALGVDGTGTPENPETPLEILLWEWELFFSRMNTETRNNFVNGLTPWVQDASNLDDLEERLKLAQEICVAGGMLFHWKFKSRSSLAEAEFQLFRWNAKRLSILKSGSPLLSGANKKISHYAERKAHLSSRSPKGYGGRRILIQDSVDAAGTSTDQILNDDFVVYWVSPKEKVRAYSWDETRWLSFKDGVFSIQPRRELQ